MSREQTLNYIHGRECSERIKKVRRAYEESKRPPMDKDNLMMQPVSEWDAIDKGKRGKVVSTPSMRFRRRWDLIDWRR